MDYGIVSQTLMVAAEAKDSGWLPSISAPWLALFGTIFGGAGLKIVESFINKPSRRDSTPAELRDELRQQIQGLKDDIASNQIRLDATEKEMNEWQDKYWKLVADHTKQQREILDHLSSIAALREQIQLQEKGKNVNGNQQPGSTV